MDSNFKVKITADLSELEKSLGNVKTLLGNVGSTAQASSRAITESTNKATTSVGNLNKTFQQTNDSSGRARLAAFAFGQVIRDAGFFSQSFGLGLLAISNNIPILIDQLILVSNVSKGVAVAFSLMGSLLTAALTVIAYTMGTSSKAANEYADSMKSATSNAHTQIATLNSLVSVAKNEELSYSARLEAINQLNKEYPELNNAINLQNINSKEAEIAVTNLTNAIIAQAKAQALAKLIGDEYGKQFEANAKPVKEHATLLDKTTASLGFAVEVYNKFGNAFNAIKSAFSGGGIAKEFKNFNNSLQTSGLKNYNEAITTSNTKIKTWQQELNNLNTSLAKSGNLYEENGKKAKTIADIYAELGIELKQINATVTNTFTKDASERVSAYQKAIDELIKIGISPASKEIKDLQDLVQRFDLAATIGQIPNIDPLAQIRKNQESGVNKMIGDAKLLGVAYKDVGIKLKQIDADVSSTFSQKSEDKIKAYKDAINFLIKNGFEPGHIAIKQFQEAMMGLEQPAQKVNEWGLYIVQTVGGDLVNAFNTMLQTGTLSFSSLAQALGNMIKKLLAAAVAAMILVTILGALGIGKGLDFKKIFGTLSGLNLSGGGEQKAFAAGGIVAGPTNALIGEYPGAKTNPEVVAPLDKLQGILASSMGSSQGPATLQTRISGNDLVILMDRANKNRNGYF
jgi:hypothetical protein